MCIMQKRSHVHIYERSLTSEFDGLWFNTKITHHAQKQVKVSQSSLSIEVCWNWTLYCIIEVYAEEESEC